MSLQLSYTVVTISTWSSSSCNTTAYLSEIIIRNWWLNNLGMICYPCIQITFNLIIDFWMPFSFCLIGPQAITQFHGSAFGFCTTKRSFAVFFLTFNMLVNKHSDLLALGFLTAVDVICTLWLSSVTSSGVDTIAASMIFFRVFGRHTYLHVDIYMFMLFKNLCSK